MPRRGFLKMGAASAAGILLPSACVSVKKEQFMGKGKTGPSKKFGAKCRTIDLTDNLNWPRDVPADSWWQGMAAHVKAYPAGHQKSWGIRFIMPEGDGLRVVFVNKDHPEAVIPVTGYADYFCTLHAWHPILGTVGAPEPGLMVGEFEIQYKSGKRHMQPIRLRFETMSLGFLTPSWLTLPFFMQQTLDHTQPTAAMTWGNAQYGFAPANFAPAPFLYVFENPYPDQQVVSFTLRGFHASPITLSGLTFYRGAGHPLRHLPRRFYRINTGAEPAKIMDAEVDLGLVARREHTSGPRNGQWLESPYIGLSESMREEPERDGEDLMEIVGAEDATVSVSLEGKEEPVEFSLGEAFHEGQSGVDGMRLEVLDRERQWMLVRVTDSSTGRPTPTRIHLSGPHGQYLAPYGHQVQINGNWFEDYGADLLVAGRRFAYCPGEFNTEMPVGEVYVEISKGFEYQPIRRRVTIAPGQEVLDLAIDRWKDLRSAGWVTADTHVHFLSPQTAWLEAQCEGVNVVNLLASQWGRLFTNVGDYTGRVGVVENDTIVYVGTENRNHMLGHMSMLGTPGLPVYPMCGGGPSESWVGDPDYMMLAEWAVAQKQKGGLVIRPHFPFCGNTEDPIPIIKELVDALEVQVSGGGKSFPVQEWYRYLNNGYRLAVVGGTDKMSAASAIGWMRTYAKLDPNEPFTYGQWADAIRAGRTISTSGPLMDMSVEGREIGDTVKLPSTGGTVGIRAIAESFIPLGILEIVHNGQVIAAEEGSGDGRKIEASARVRIERSGWIAARCTARADHPGSYAAAHTSPIYIKCGDTRAFDGPAIQHMLALVEGGREYMQKLSTTFNDAARQRMLRLFDEARTELRKRLREEGDIMPHHGSGPYHVHGPGQAPHKH